MSSCVKIFQDNYVDIDLLASTSVSSEQVAFPVTNAYNMNRRSKVWRSNGYWEIESGSNTIVFTEGGSDLTATIPAGTYSTTASFITALDAAFTTAPGAAGSYTITQSSTLKFVITKSAGTFTIKWTDAGSTDMAAILGFDDSADATGALSYTADVLKINTEEFILWDMGIASKPSAFMMIGPRNRPFKLSPSGVFKLQGNHTNNFSSPAYSITLDYNDEVIGEISEDSLHTEGLRYWRVQFVDQNPNGYVEIGSFFLGQYFSPERGRVQFPFQSQFIDRSTVVVSEGGQIYSDVYEQSQGFSIEWLGLEKEDIEEITRIFRNYGKSFPIFVSFDTAEAFSTEFERMLKLAYFTAEPTYQLISPNNFTCSMQFREAL